MKVTYDGRVDVLRIELSDEAVDESDEARAGVILDYDRAGNVVGIEILDASRHVKDPRSLEHAVSA